MYLEQKFFFRKLDGNVVTKRIVCDSTRSRAITTHTTDKATGNMRQEDKDVKPVSFLQEAFENDVDRLIDLGWVSSDDYVEDDYFAFLGNCNEWPSRLKFNPPQDTNELGYIWDIGDEDDDPILFSAIRGVSVMVLLGSLRAQSMTKDGKPYRLPKKIMAECVHAYGKETLIRGIWDGSFFSVWDVPYRNGVDNCFEQWGGRAPTYNGEFVGIHTKPSEDDRVCLVVHPGIYPDTTMYSCRGKTAFIADSWLYRPRPSDPELGVVLQQNGYDRQMRDSFLGSAPFDPKDPLLVSITEGVGALLRSI